MLLLNAAGMDLEVRVREEGGSQGWLLLFLVDHYGVVGVLLGLSMFSWTIGHGKVLEVLPMGQCWVWGAAVGGSCRASLGFMADPLVLEQP